MRMLLVITIGVVFGMAVNAPAGESTESKVFYVITQGAGLGGNIRRVPITGGETVLDALCTVNGVWQVSTAKIWIARPVPGGLGCEQILPVDYEAIARGDSLATNYQILPGDRVFVSEDDSTAPIKTSPDAIRTKLSEPSMDQPESPTDNPRGQRSLGQSCRRTRNRHAFSR